MQKKDLLAIPRPDVKARHLDRDIIKGGIGVWWTHSDAYTVAARIVKNERFPDAPSGVLAVWLWDHSATLRYGVFVSVDLERWYVYDYEGERWREAMLCNLTGYNSAIGAMYRYADAESACLGSYFKSEDTDTLRSLDAFQVDKKKYATKKKLLRARSAIDALMAAVPLLPKDVDRYIENHVLKNDYYVWYEKRGKKLVGCCTHCGERFEALKYPSGKLHNADWKCPKCKSAVTLKNINIAASWHDHESFVIAQSIPGGVMMTRYRVYQSHDKTHAVKYLSGLNAERVEYRSVYAMNRTRLLFDGAVTSYVYEARNNYLGSGCEWYVDGDGMWSSTIGEAMVYPYNLSRIFNDTKWRYTGAAAMARSDVRFDLLHYIRSELDYPFVEKCAKVGLYRLALDLSHGYSSRARDLFVSGAKSNDKLTSLFGINKAQLRLFASLNATAEEIKLYKLYDAFGKTPTEKELRALHALEGGRDDRFVSYLTGKDYGRIRRSWRLSKLVKYVSGQLEREYKGSYAVNVLQDLKDYHCECIELGYDMRDEGITMPRNLREAHAGTSMLIEHKKNEAANKKIEKRRAKLEGFYNYEKGDYLIRMAKDGDELFVEGKTQNICVGRYVGSYADGKCTILLLRRAEAPDVPFVTVEVREHEDYIEDVQIRAYRNQTPDGATMSWWRAYKKNVLAKLGGEPWAAEHGKEPKKKDAKKAS